MHHALLRAIEFLFLPFQQIETPSLSQFLLLIRESFAEGVDCIQELGVLFAIQVGDDAHLGVELQWIA